MSEQDQGVTAGQVMPPNDQILTEGQPLTREEVNKQLSEFRGIYDRRHAQTSSELETTKKLLADRDSQISSLSKRLDDTSAEFTRFTDSLLTPEELKEKMREREISGLRQEIATLRATPAPAAEKPTSAYDTPEAVAFRQRLTRITGVPEDHPGLDRSGFEAYEASAFRIALERERTDAVKQHQNTGNFEQTPNASAQPTRLAAADTGSPAGLGARPKLSRDLAQQLGEKASRGDREAAKQLRELLDEAQRELGNG